MRHHVCLIVAAFVDLSAAQCAFAQGGGPQLLGQFGDWGAYRGVQNDQKVCYALSQSQPEPNRGRGKSYAMISTRPAVRVVNEFSILADYSFTLGLEATAQIDSETFALYTRDDGAWLKNAADQAPFLAAMRRGQVLLVKGKSAAGVPTVDRYVLKGLGQAVDRATAECRGETTTPTVSPQPSEPAPPSVPSISSPAPPVPRSGGSACERFPNLC
jgi:hypothetical protein